MRARMLRNLTRLGAALPLLFLAASTGCNDGGAPSVDDALALANARAKWAAKGPDFYTYELQQECFCPSYGWVRIVVRENAVVSVEVIETGATLDPALWPTIEQLFERLAQAQQNDEMLADIEYRFDRTYGYPTLAEFTTTPDIVDGNLRYEARALEPTPR